MYDWVVERYREGSLEKRVKDVRRMKDFTEEGTGRIVINIRWEELKNKKNSVPDSDSSSDLMSPWEELKI